MTITGFPAASAEAVSPPSTENANGKLLAAKLSTGPTGTRYATEVGTDAERERVVGIVDPHVEVAAVDDHIAEQPQLHSGALELAGQSRVGQAGLVLRNRDQVGLRRVERISDGDERPGTFARLEPRPRGSGIRGALGDGVEFFGGQ